MRSPCGSVSSRPEPRTCSAARGRTTRTVVPWLEPLGRCSGGPPLVYGLVGAVGTCGSRRASAPHERGRDGVCDLDRPRVLRVLARIVAGSIRSPAAPWRVLKPCQTISRSVARGIVSGAQSRSRRRDDCAGGKSGPPHDKRWDSAVCEKLSCCSRNGTRSPDFLRRCYATPIRCTAQSPTCRIHCVRAKEKMMPSKQPSKRPGRAALCLPNRRVHQQQRFATRLERCLEVIWRRKMPSAPL